VVEADVTLKEAILAVDREYGEEVRGFVLDKPAEARAALQTQAEQQAVEDSGIDGRILSAAASAETPIHMLLSICIRFGMRVQRKLDHPERVTTVCHGTAEAEKVEPTLPTPKVVLN
jgi:hypothetical protein